MNEPINMTHDEKAKIGQAINLACTSLQGTNYTQDEVIKLVFGKYLPLITAVQKEYMTRRDAMQKIVDCGFSCEDVDTTEKDPLSDLF
jgi:hypothetical protein